MKPLGGGGGVLSLTWINPNVAKELWGKINENN